MMAWMDQDTAKSITQRRIPMEHERELLENLINQAVESGNPLFTEEIVQQSQNLDRYIVEHMKGGENLG